MKIAIPRERPAQETRVAASPDTVRKLVGLGCEVAVETGAGAEAAYPDEAYKDAGAAIAKDAAAACQDAQVVLKVRGPEAAELAGLAPGTVLVAMLDPYGKIPEFKFCAARVAPARAAAE